ncbi:hypothetical protein H6G80_24895 [Nostoc sp. FACHB-87]|uniref:hypothetical protein n=1 Tax=Nostocaceae TaxID=1162 RepID=UPI0016872EBB|nr:MULTISPECIES: hypothetical protein [Nostocaceae]MBD2457301.1 hypothetical protein [Nostoc sp. FACHB-87]MBD2478370.1 hypothetical protein [Anabaena sp. FACHB-83]
MIISLNEATRRFFDCLDDQEPEQERNNRLAEVFGINSLILGSGGTEDDCVVAMAAYVYNHAHLEISQICELFGVDAVFQAQPLVNNTELSVIEQIDQHAELICRLPEQVLRISVCRTLYYSRLRQYHGLTKDWSIYETLVRNYVKYCSENSLQRLVAEIATIYSWHTKSQA